VAIVGRIDLPSPRRSRDPVFRRKAARRLAAFEPNLAQRRTVDIGPTAVPDPDAVDAARAALRLEERMTRRVPATDRDLLQRFRKLVGLLEERGYVADWTLTDKGERLRRIYSDLDLLVSASLETGLFDGLGGPDTAALVSGFTFEPRRDAADAAWPNPITDRAAMVETLWADLAERERRLGLPETRPPDPGFAATARRWTAGEPLARVLGDDLAVGDFVRSCRQLIDLLRQIADSGHPGAPGVTGALAGLDRGVVAAIQTQW
jgi:ATP-dependent RNA helicase HelY